MLQQRTILELARVDRARANLWAVLNGSGDDCRRADDLSPGSATLCDCHYGPSHSVVARAIRDRMTDELLSRD